eukprot:TRINITY_DN778_c0_g1_i6.p1 TRINITY_DN778_c0_g1~~TRINITY_DN778_c0_g1_i6.p1  ORF type:complete len:111 (+),score=3.46 TRINITY_DN778_c0_g1_i6:103-435(+)
MCIRDRYQRRVRGRDSTSWHRCTRIAPACRWSAHEVDLRGLPYHLSSAFSPRVNTLRRSHCAITNNPAAHLASSDPSLTFHLEGIPPIEVCQVSRSMQNRSPLPRCSERP